MHGGDAPGLPRQLEEILDIVKSSPIGGRIRVLVRPTEEAMVGDTIKIESFVEQPWR